MGAYSYETLREHIGHKIVCVCYGPKKGGGDPDNVAVECEDCDLVLFDYNKPEEGISKERKGEG
jgi:hypothetical protein